jgi:hypothetical protein
MGDDHGAFFDMPACRSIPAGVLCAENRAISSPAGDESRKRPSDLLSSQSCIKAATPCVRASGRTQGLQFERIVGYSLREERWRIEVDFA